MTTKKNSKAGATKPPTEAKPQEPQAPTKPAIPEDEKPAEPPAPEEPPTQEGEKPAEPPAPEEPPTQEGEKPAEPPAPTKPPIPEDEKENKGKHNGYKKRIERAREVFATHTVDTLFFTEDGTCFLQIQHARMHADSLKSEVVITVTRKEVE